MVKQKILLTGASGTIGKEVFKEILNRSNEYEISLFLRGSKKNRKLFRQHIDKVRIIWGSLQNLKKVQEALIGQDIVIHMAGALPDVAFKNPELVVSTNVDGTKNIIEAMKTLPNPPKIIYTSSVTVYGDRRKNPIIKLSDPINIDTKDLYASTKIKVENLIRESGLEYIIFRVSYVLALEVLKFRRVMFYIAPDTSVEIIHVKDLGLALVNAIDSKEIWNKTFNIGGGKQCQIIYKDNISDMFELMGFGRDFMPEEAFSKHDSHCGFFDEEEMSSLNRILKFQNRTIEDFYKEVKKWIGVKRYFVPLVKPILRWYLLRKSEFYQKFKESSP